MVTCVTYALVTCVDIKVGKSPEDIVGKEAFHSCLLLCPCQIIDGYCLLFIAFKPILHRDQLLQVDDEYIGLRSFRYKVVSLQVDSLQI